MISPWDFVSPGISVLKLRSKRLLFQPFVPGLRSECKRLKFCALRSAGRLLVEHRTLKSNAYRIASADSCLLMPWICMALAARLHRRQYSWHLGRLLQTGIEQAT